MFTPLNVRRLINWLIDKFCPFNVKSFQLIVAAITVLLLGTVLILGWMSSKKVREVVTKDFNQQQLVLAQHAAGQIKSNINILKKELSLLSLSPSVQYFERVSLGNRMNITYSSVKEEGVLEIRYIESKFRTHQMSDHGYQTVATYPECLEYLNWARQKGNKGRVLITEVSPVIYGSSYHTLVIKMMTPVWQVSVDDAYPLPTNRFSGVLVFIIDTTAFVDKVIKGIRSGRTGYAWVIDHKGLFLSHPEDEFIGKNAFEARKAKKQTISFARINEIQKDMMLIGKEGMSWYVSGWHRGVEGEMEKLIAYTPIRLDDSAEHRIWSAAVVAPVSEVEGAVRDIQIRQFLLEGIVVFAILAGGAAIIGMMLRWSSQLTSEVQDKTKELRKSENQYRSLIERANDIIFTVDREGNIASINTAGCYFFKKTREEILGRNIREVCFNEESASAQYGAISTVFNSQASRQITYPVTVGGNEYWLSTNFSGLIDDKGEVYSVLGIARDITKRKKMEEQMYHTEKLASLGTLAAGVAHEINNPLAIILGFTDMLLEKSQDKPECQDMLKTIEKHGTNAKRVVENLLSFARYSEQKEENVDVNKCVEAVLSVAGNNLSLNKITVRREIAELLPLVKCSAGELQQVFFNIITNAIFAMKGGGALTVSTAAAKDGRKVEVRIGDTGLGIRKEHRIRIFDPLFTTKKVGEGTGLGLSVSYGIIAKYGGSIVFDTKTKDESDTPGTTFIISLPAVMQENGE